MSDLHDLMARRGYGHPDHLTEEDWAELSRRALADGKIVRWVAGRALGHVDAEGRPTKFDGKGFAVGQRVRVTDHKGEVEEATVVALRKDMLFNVFLHRDSRPEPDAMGIGNLSILEVIE